MSDKSYTEDSSVPDEQIYNAVTSNGSINTKHNQDTPELPDFHDDFRVRKLSMNTESIFDVYGERNLLVAVTSRYGYPELLIIPEGSASITLTEDGFRVESPLEPIVTRDEREYYHELFTVHRNQTVITDALAAEQRGPSSIYYTHSAPTTDVTEQLRSGLRDTSQPVLDSTNGSTQWVYGWADSYGIYAPVSATVDTDVRSTMWVEWSENDVLTHLRGSARIRRSQSGLYISNIHYVSADEVPDVDDDTDRVIGTAEIAGPERHG